MEPKGPGKEEEAGMSGFPSSAQVVVIGAGLSLLGIAIVCRLARPQDEPRVLTGAGGGRDEW